MEVKTEIRKSERLIQWIDSKIDGLKISAQDRDKLAVGCFDMVLEHQKALLLLTANALYGSSAALVRLIFESYVRGCWLHYCATDNQIQQFKQDKLDSKFHELIDELEKHEAFNGGTLSWVKKVSYRVMNSFTHSGFHQVRRRISGGSVIPNYTDSEIIDALESANAFAILAMIAIADMANDVSLANEVYEMWVKPLAKTSKQA